MFSKFFFKYRNVSDNWPHSNFAAVQEIIKGRTAQHEDENGGKHRLKFRRFVFVYISPRGYRKLIPAVKGLRTHSKDYFL